ncbi:MAG: hypothetical protein IPH89_00260 [Bacteroidetes bacterium]|nr:hypothetical protein [Bacteroidota bacterium]
MDRRERNLHFRSKISEAYAAVEIYPTFFLEKYDGLKGKLRPYFLAGVGIYHFDPETKDVDGSWVKVAPLRLEGQGFAEYPDSKPYKLTQKNVLGGVGFKYYIKENAYIGFEILHRKLFTDYVDDVSHNYYIDPIYFDQYLSAADAVKARRLYYRGIYSFPATRPYEEFAERGDPKENDAYFSSIIRFGWRIGGIDATKQLKCPVFIKLYNHQNPNPMKQTLPKQHLTPFLVFTGLFAGTTGVCEGKPFRIYGLTVNKPEEEKPAKKKK